MREKTNNDFLFDLECSSGLLSSAIKNLYLLRDGLYSDVFAMEKRQAFLGTDHLMDCCDAMTTAFRELERIQDEIDAIVNAAYAEQHGGT